MELLEGMLQREKDEFSRVCNRLLGSCFLCKRNETNKADYYFVLKYKEKFSEYLSLLGYRLEINEEYGVVQLYGEVIAYMLERNVKLEQECIEE